MSYWKMKPGPEREQAKQRPSSPIQHVKTERVCIDGVFGYQGPSGHVHRYNDRPGYKWAKLASRTPCAPLDPARFEIVLDDSGLYIVGKASGVRTYVPDDLCVRFTELTIQHVLKVEASTPKTPEQE